MTPKPTSNPRRVRPRRIAAAIALILLVLTSSMWARTRFYLDVADDNAAVADASIYRLNAALSEFEGDPRTAGDIAQRLNKEVGELDERAASIRELSAPRAAAAHHDALADFYDASAAFAKLLRGEAEYVKARGEVMERMASAVQRFQSSLGATSADSEVLSRAAELKAETDQASATLAALEEDGPHVYTNETLDAYIAELSDTLVELDSGLRAGSAPTVMAAASNLAVVLSADWESALFSASPAGSARLNERAVEVEQESARVDGERAVLDEWARGMALLALAAGAAAVLLLLASRS